MSLPARNRPPPPMPGTPEAEAAEKERLRIIEAGRVHDSVVHSPGTPLPPSTEMMLPTVQVPMTTATELDAGNRPWSGSIASLPPLPASKRLKVIPAAIPYHTVNKLGQKEYDMDRVPDATGKKPAAFVPHSYGGGSRGQPDWVNQMDGGPVCSVCGVQETSNSIIMPGGIKGMKYIYRDAANLEIVSMIPLGCPTFIGHPNGAIGEAKQRIRQLDEHVETVDARLDRLENYVTYLQGQLEAKIQLDVQGLVNWIGQMTALSAQNQLPTATVEVAGLGYSIPTPIADLIRGVGDEVTIDVELEPDEEDPGKKEGNK